MGHAIDDERELWPDGRVPYEIDADDFPPGSRRRERIEQAIDHWNDRTVVRLVPRRGEDDYVDFVRADIDRRTCNSATGRQGGRQAIRCAQRNPSASLVAHEIGHAVGLEHEHQRSDRDEFVAVNRDNVEEDARAQFDIIEGQLIGDYDYESIMHYERRAFSRSSLRDTITPLQDVEIGGESLSGRDVWAVNVLYGRASAPIVFQADRDRNGLYQILLSGMGRKGQHTIGDVVVNSRAAGQQRRPVVGMDERGGLVVVWEDDREDDGVYQIRARSFEADGKERFADRTINRVARGQQRRPSVAVHASGDFVVAWQDDATNNGRFRIKLRALDDEGRERFEDVVSEARADARNPCISMAPDGSFVVVYQEDRERSGSYEVRARMYGAEGGRRREFRVNEASACDQKRPRVFVDLDGRFVVVWQDDVDGDGRYEVKARGFDADGSERFSTIIVNKIATRGQQVNPDVAMMFDGSFFVVWQDDTGNDGLYQIKGRTFSAQGEARELPFTINAEAAGQQRRPRVSTPWDAGLYLVVWEDDPDRDGDYQIRASVFAFTHGEQLSSVLVNRHTEGDNLFPSVGSHPY